MNNLYIINEVLYDLTPGMAVIAAPSLDRCRELFADKFVDGSWDTDQELREFDSAIKDGDYKVIENVNHDEGVVSYVVGGS
jgi:hypothetical protein